MASRTRHIRTSERGHGNDQRSSDDTEGELFRPISNNRTRELDNTIIPDGVYKLERRYALDLGLKIGAHAQRAAL